jgi:phytol kinase
MLNPWLGIVFVAAALVTAMMALKFCSDRCHVAPELLRKILHVCMGVVTLLFPWMFSTVWPVVILAAVSVWWLWSVQWCRPLQQFAGGVTDGVSRHTCGELYFPVAIALLFWLSQGNLLLYVIPVLVLTFADALAAVVGLRYGAHRYTIGAGIKSWEGSATFFVVALCVVFLSLLFMAGMPGSKALLVAVVTALPVTFVEAISHTGWDNLLVPLSTLFILSLFL